jgi:hypothetical protein
MPLNILILIHIIIINIYEHDQITTAKQCVEYSKDVSVTLLDTQDDNNNHYQHINVRPTRIKRRKIDTE